MTLRFWIAWTIGGAVLAAVLFYRQDPQKTTWRTWAGITMGGPFVWLTFAVFSLMAYRAQRRYRRLRAAEAAWQREASQLFNRERKPHPWLNN